MYLMSKHTACYNIISCIQRQSILYYKSKKKLYYKSKKLYYKSKLVTICNFAQLSQKVLIETDSKADKHLKWDWKICKR